MGLPFWESFITKLLCLSTSATICGEIEAAGRKSFKSTNSPFCAHLITLTLTRAPFARQMYSFLGFNLIFFPFFDFAPWQVLSLSDSVESESELLNEEVEWAESECFLE